MTQNSPENSPFESLLLGADGRPLNETTDPIVRPSQEPPHDSAGGPVILDSSGAELSLDTPLIITPNTDRETLSGSDGVIIKPTEDEVKDITLPSAEEIEPTPVDQQELLGILMNPFKKTAEVLDRSFSREPEISNIREHICKLMQGRSSTYASLAAVQEVTAEEALYGAKRLETCRGYQSNLATSFEHRDKDFSYLDRGESKVINSRIPSAFEMACTSAVKDALQDPLCSASGITPYVIDAVADVIRHVKNQNSEEPEFKGLATELIKSLQEDALGVTTRESIYEVLAEISLSPEKAEQVLQIQSQTETRVDIGEYRSDLYHPSSNVFLCTLQKNSKESTFLNNQQRLREYLLEKLATDDVQSLFDQYDELSKIADKLVHSGAADGAKTVQGNLGLEIEYAEYQEGQNDSFSLMNDSDEDKNIPTGWQLGYDINSRELQTDKSHIAFNQTWEQNLSAGTSFIHGEAIPKIGEMTTTPPFSLHIHVDRETTSEDTVKNIFLAYFHDPMKESPVNRHGLYKTWEVRGLAVPHSDTWINANRIMDLGRLALECRHEPQKGLQKLKLNEKNTYSSAELHWGHLIRNMPSAEGRLSALCALKDPRIFSACDYERISENFDRNSQLKFIEESYYHNKSVGVKEVTDKYKNALQRVVETSLTHRERSSEITEQESKLYLQAIKTGNPQTLTQILNVISKTTDQDKFLDAIRLRANDTKDPGGQLAACHFLWDNGFDTGEKYKAIKSDFHALIEKPTSESLEEVNRLLKDAPILLDKEDRLTLTNLLSHPDVNVRYQTLEIFKESLSPTGLEHSEVEKLLRYYSESSSDDYCSIDVRNIFSDYKGCSPATLLGPCLESEDAVVRKGLFQMLEDDSDLAAECSELLERGIDDKDPGAQKYAMTALLESINLTEEVQRKIGGSFLGLHSRSQIAVLDDFRRLNKLSDGERTDILKTALDSDNDNVIASAATVLETNEELIEENSVADFSEQLKVKLQNCGMFTKQKILRLMKTVPGLADAAADEIFTCAHDSTWETIYQADTIIQQHPEWTVPEQLKERFDSGSFDVRCGIISHLGHRPTISREFQPILTKALESESSKLKALTLNQLDDENFAPMTIATSKAIVRACEDPDPSIKIAAIKVLKVTDESLTVAACEQLVRALADENNETVEAALSKISDCPRFANQSTADGLASFIEDTTEEHLSDQALSILVANNGIALMQKDLILQRLKPDFPEDKRRFALDFLKNNPDKIADSLSDLYECMNAETFSVTESAMDLLKMDPVFHSAQVIETMLMEKTEDERINIYQFLKDLDSLTEDYASLLKRGLEDPSGLCRTLSAEMLVDNELALSAEDQHQILALAYDIDVDVRESIACRLGDFSKVAINEKSSVLADLLHDFNEDIIGQALASLADHPELVTPEIRETVTMILSDEESSHKTKALAAVMGESDWVHESAAVIAENYTKGDDDYALLMTVYLRENRDLLITSPELQRFAVKVMSDEQVASGTRRHTAELIAEIFPEIPDANQQMSITTELLPHITSRNSGAWVASVLNEAVIPASALASITPTLNNLDRRKHDIRHLGNVCHRIEGDGDILLEPALGLLDNSGTRLSATRLLERLPLSQNAKDKIITKLERELSANHQNKDDLSKVSDLLYVTKAQNIDTSHLHNKLIPLITEPEIGESIAECLAGKLNQNDAFTVAELLERGLNHEYDTASIFDILDAAGGKDFPRSELTGLILDMSRINNMENAAVAYLTDCSLSSEALFLINEELRQEIRETHYGVPDEHQFKFIATCCTILSYHDSLESDYIDSLIPCVLDPELGDIIGSALEGQLSSANLPALQNVLELVAEDDTMYYCPAIDRLTCSISCNADTLLPAIRERFKNADYDDEPERRFAHLPFSLTALKELGKEMNSLLRNHEGGVENYRYGTRLLKMFAYRRGAGDSCPVDLIEPFGYGYAKKEIADAFIKSGINPLEYALIAGDKTILDESFEEDKSITNRVLSEAPVRMGNFVLRGPKAKNS